MTYLEGVKALQGVTPYIPVPHCEKALMLTQNVAGPVKPITPRIYWSGKFYKKKKALHEIH